MSGSLSVRNEEHGASFCMELWPAGETPDPRTHPCNFLFLRNPLL